MSADSRIPIRIANKRAYVWDVDDIAKIRSEHNICGILSGTLPHLSQQNVFLGVPLVLMPEEVVLLMEKELAVLINDPASYPPPTTHHLTSWAAAQKNDIRQQVVLAEAKAAKDDELVRGRGMSEAAVEKRRVREERRAAAAAAASASEGSSTSSVFIPTPPPPPPRPSPPPTQSPPASYTITLPSTSTSLPWYHPAPHTYFTLASAREAGIWDYPSTLEERARCGVFRGLWEEGFFMGGGIKFGSDWLVYPGDPLRYHSHFAATVIDSPLSPLRPMEIVAHGRLGTATKKAHLLCGWDEEKGEVSFLSVEWAGFG